MIAEIRMFAGNFAPQGWAFCDGQLLAISSHSTLFSILGTLYGGDGKTTFALPDLRGRVALHAGRGPGLSDYREGQKGGQEQITLNSAQMPSHNHSVMASTAAGNSSHPTGRVWGDTGGFDQEYVDQVPNTPMQQQIISHTGGNQPFDNRQPFICVKFIIAMVGIYPSHG